jgi:hypothetical protein
MTIAEARRVSLAGRVSSASTGSPRVENFVAYVGLNFVPHP